MKPFTTVIGPGVVLSRDNVDTDQLIPARFMKRTRAEGYGEQLLHDLRFDRNGKPDPDFPLNRTTAPPVFMVAGRNFGCGSSREAAVYALVDHGIRVVVAESFADIFRGNAARNGLLTIALDASTRQRLAASVNDGDRALEIDLQAQQIRGEATGTIGFDVEPSVKRRLLLGLDEVSETLENEPAIAAFEALYFERTPWVVPGTS